MNDTVNPYQSPAAGTAEIGAQDVYEPKIFAMSGRIGRLRYFAYSNIYALIFYFFLFVIMLALGGFAGGGAEEAGVAMMVSLGVLYIAFLVGVVVLMRRRLHDLGKTSWVGLLMLVPLVNLFFALYLLFAKGESGVNDYGSQPIKNHGGLWFFALVPFFFAVVGILAAVAIPAYQEYVERAAAHAAQ